MMGGKGREGKGREESSGIYTAEETNEEMTDTKILLLCHVPRWKRAQALGLSTESSPRSVE